MGLQITTVQGQHKFNTINAQLYMQQPKGKQSIRQPKAEMTINRELPRVEIDQYQCFAEAGLKNNTDLRKQFSQLSYRKALEGIAKRVSEGNRMSNIRKGNYNVIPLIAQESTKREKKEYNYDIMPKSRPKIDVKGHLNIDWKINKPIIEYTPQKPIIDYNPGKVEVYIDPYPSIDIQYIDEKR